VFGVPLEKVLQRSVYDVPEVLIICFLLIETYRKYSLKIQLGQDIF